MKDYPIIELEDVRHLPWNKGRLIGQKLPLKPREIWAIRVRLQILRRIRDLALFNLAIDSKLRGCDLVRLRVGDVTQGGKILNRAMVMQIKTGQPVKFEITEQTREAVSTWIKQPGSRAEDYLFPSRFHAYPHISTRQYARIVKYWVSMIDLDASLYGTHSLRRTKPTLILPPHQESTCCAAPVGSHEARKHCEIPWD